MPVGRPVSEELQTLPSIDCLEVGCLAGFLFPLARKPSRCKIGMFSLYCLFFFAAAVVAARALLRPD